MDKIILVVLVLSTLMLVGCTDNNEGTYQVIDTRDIYENEEFITWELNDLNAHDYYQDKIHNEINKDVLEINWFSMERWSRLCKEGFAESKLEAQSFHLSPEYDRVRDAYYEYLDNMWYSNYHMEQASICLQSGLLSDDFDEGLSHLDDVSLYLERATNALDRATSYAELIP